MTCIHKLIDVCRYQHQDKVGITCILENQRIPHTTNKRKRCNIDKGKRDDSTSITNDINITKTVQLLHDSTSITNDINITKTVQLLPYEIPFMWSYNINNKWCGQLMSTKEHKLSAIHKLICKNKHYQQLEMRNVRLTLLVYISDILGLSIPTLRMYTLNPDEIYKRIQEEMNWMKCIVTIDEVQKWCEYLIFPEQVENEPRPNNATKYRWKNVLSGLICSIREDVIDIVNKLVYDIPHVFTSYRQQYHPQYEDNNCCNQKTLQEIMIDFLHHVITHIRDNTLCTLVRMITKDNKKVGFISTNYLWIYKDDLMGEDMMNFLAKLEHKCSNLLNIDMKLQMNS